MTPGRIYKRTVVDRLAWVERMLAEIKELPLHDRDLFFEDRRNLATAESCLRRALEALLALERHMLAKGFAIARNIKRSPRNWVRAAFYPAMKRIC